MALVLWVSVFLCVYTYIVFPLFLHAIAGKRQAQALNTPAEGEQPFISVLVPAYNEEKAIRAKIENCLNQRYPMDKVEFLFGSDGSTDGTNSILSEFVDKANVRAFFLPRSGKSAVIRHLLSKAKGDIVVLSDATSMWGEETLDVFSACFRDSNVGAVGVIPEFVDREGNAKNGAYERLERLIKSAESSIGCVVGLSGSVYAIRRSIIDDIPSNVINDDFYISTLPAFNRMKIILTEQIRVKEQVNSTVADTFSRYVRMSVGNMQFLKLHGWRLLLNLKFAFLFASHRLLRWMVPFLLLVIFFSNLLLLSHELYRLMMATQLLLYGFSVFGIANQRGKVTNRLCSVAGQFVLVNVAYLVGFLRWTLRRYDTKWETSR
jgi:cellulose synthase/poly-beta-1,6-N-acetylglucosamine synthase-like glycosyltransferase